MKLIRIINNDSFRTYSKDKVEKVTYKGKKYIASRYIDYSKTNTLTLRKQKLALELINKGANLEEVAKALGVKFSTLYMWWSHSRLEVMKGDD